MGIHGLNKFVAEKAPGAVEHAAPQSFMGRTVAVDASTCLYAFMIAIRDSENYGNLTNEAGEATSHIAGMLSRAIRMLELGMKPVYVFDGKPPLLKSGELARRKDRKAQAEAEMKEAKELGDDVRVKQLAGRMVRVTKKHNDDVKKLLKLMGIPIIEAPGEAESQCAMLCRAGKADATVSEDSDSLCFGTPLLLRSMNFTDKKQPVMVYHLDKLLQTLNFNQEQFIEFCILCGCDYCDSIKGIGPATAYKLLKDYGSIERIIDRLCTRPQHGTATKNIYNDGIYTQGVMNQDQDHMNQEQVTGSNEQVTGSNEQVTGSNEQVTGSNGSGTQTESLPELNEISGSGIQDVDKGDDMVDEMVGDGLDKKGSDQKKKKLYELPFMYPWAEAKQLFVYPDVIPLEELKDLDFQQKELQGG
ncbi:flap endonuclease 1 [Gregarina niphandrodes]|uniref:Flap endonuclease 1 n=1 Tax=Gregarina niphandrodes TaxID=110365 RepID=A0A023B9S8_GRENI|nr:flap endonuclease 1 [Gregarina niphandrodes]EZG74926.1 flap endonuclease 1 [Gregarina niphandrodes]|eukprot:XP_011129616.1 flap endonuclease 1 [Gregarina niphandrodes]